MRYILLDNLGRGRLKNEKFEENGCQNFNTGNGYELNGRV